MVITFANPPRLVFAFEQRYRREYRQEHALLLDARGNVVVERTGNENSVEFTKQELDRACLGLLSHNHPKGLPPSKDDLLIASEYGLTLRAVGETPDGESYEYTVRFVSPSAELAKLVSQQFDNEIGRAETELSDRNWPAWKWERESRHLAVSRLAQKYKFAYQRVQRNVPVSEARGHETERLNVLAGVERAMRDDVLNPLYMSLVSMLTRHADHAGVIPVSSLETVRRGADRLVQHTILGAPSADNILAPYHIRHGEVVPHSPYFKTLWALMRTAAGKAVDEHADIMRKYLPDDLRRLLEFATISPFDTSLAEAQDDDNNPILLGYDPLHRWLGSDDKQLSDRIWNVAGDLRRKLDQYLTRAIATNIPVQQIAKELEPYLLDGKGSYEAMRLARTEVSSAYSRASSAGAQMNPFVESYSFFTAPTHQCCDVCDVVQAGSPYPKDDTKHLSPQHPFCLCRVVWNIVKDVAGVIAALRKQIERALADARRSIADVVGPLSKRFLELLFRGHS